MKIRGDIFHAILLLLWGLSFFIRVHYLIATAFLAWKFKRPINCLTQLICHEAGVLQ